MGELGSDEGLGRGVGVEAECAQGPGIRILLQGRALRRTFSEFFPHCPFPSASPISPLASGGKAPDPPFSPTIRYWIPDPSFLWGGERESPRAARALGGGDGCLTQ